jgi:hypothetical protein
MSNNNNNNLWLGEDQRLLLEMYLGFYNTTQRQIDSLQETQQINRRNIDSITGISNMNNTNNMNNNNRSYNTFPQTNSSANTSLPSAFDYMSSQNTTSNTNNNNRRNNSYHNSNLERADAVGGSRRNSSNIHNTNTNSNSNNQNRRRSRQTPSTINYGVPSTHNNLPYEHTNERIELNGRTYLIDLLRFNTNNTASASASATTTATAPLDYLNILQNFYSNVPVRPSQRQIDIATRIIRFGDIEDPLNNSCPITLERFNNSNNVTQILECRHNFNSVNINEWFNSNVRCPVCRYDIRNYRHTPRVVPRAAREEETKEETKEEETKEEETKEETKEEDEEEEETKEEETPHHLRSESDGTRPFDMSDNELMDAFSDMTESILNSLFPQLGSMNINLGNYTIDTSGNDVVIQSGSVRR